MRRLIIMGGVVCGVLASTAQARDLCEMLRDNGVLTDIQFNECKANLEKEAAKTEQVAKEATGSRWKKWLDMLTPFGDLRLRDEGFYANHLVGDNRARYRARIGLNVTPNDEISTTFRLASGNPNNPTSRNQTFDNTFTSSSINLDWAFMTLKPGQTFGIPPGWFSITGGKFGINLVVQRISELVFDDDLSPEGVTETLNLYSQNEGILRSFKINANQWTVSQIQNSQDTFMWGGQGVANLAFGNAAVATLTLSDWYYQNVNIVAQKFLNPSSPSFNSQLENSNDVVIKNGQIVAYKYGFNILEGGADVGFPSLLDFLGTRIPCGWFGDFAVNTQAPSGRNFGLYTGVGISKSILDWDYYHDTVVKQGEWGLSFTYVWVQKDAVLSIFSFDDLIYKNQNATQNGGTNVIAYIPRFDYAVFDGVFITLKGLIINALDPQISNVKLVGSSTLLRTQADITLRF